MEHLDIEEKWPRDHMNTRQRGKSKLAKLVEGLEFDESVCESNTCLTYNSIGN